jgi:hypothetical protein
MLLKIKIFFKGDVMKKYTLTVTSIFIILFVLSLMVFWYQGKRETDIIIADDIARLDAIFEKINETCTIINFEHQKNYIDFLTIKSFVGSEVGPMNLAYPDKWEGPYLDDNPTMQEKYYQVVHTKHGYFIVPGPGVRLTNGKVIGKDITFDEDADIPSMIKNGLLQFQGRPLASKIMDGFVPEIPKGQRPEDRMMREQYETYNA